MKTENNRNAEQGTINKSRRKLSKSGLVAPVLLSLSSKPSWASVCNFSGAMSGNLSAQKTGPVCDSSLPSTKSPGYYKTVSHWPQSNCSVPGTLADNGGTKFNAVFGAPTIKLKETESNNPALSVEQLLNPSILNVLCNNSKIEWTISAGNDAKSAAFHYSAAIISACAEGLVFPFTPEEVKTAWTNQDSDFLSVLEKIQNGEYDVAEVAQKIKW